MNILLANNYAELRGGSERYVEALAQLLDERGDEVALFRADGHSGPAPVDLHRPLWRQALRLLWSGEAARKLERLLTVRRIDLAHLHIYYGQLTAAILPVLRRRGIPMVQTLHEYKLTCPTSLHWRADAPCHACRDGHYWPATRHRCNRGSRLRSLGSTLEAYMSRALGALGGVDHFITVSEHARAVLAAQGVPSRRMTTVYNFIDTARIPVANGPGEYLLYLGRLERYKGIYTLLDAAARLPNIPLVLTGDGPERANIEAAIRARGLRNVFLAGFRRGAALERIIARCRCLVMPSEVGETFGMVLLESLARGRPVVASAVGAIPEVVRDGLDGVLVPPGDPKALADELRWLTAHPQQAAAMGRDGRAGVQTRFSPERHYAALQAVYRQVLGARATLPARAG